MNINYSSLNNFSKEFLFEFKCIIENNNFAGVVLAEEAEKLYKLSEMEKNDLLLSLLPFIKQYAQTDISNFNVSAIARGGSGNLYFGANIEFPRETLMYTVHAEQAAIINALIHKETEISEIVVSYIPCALCRQVMRELNNWSSLKIILSDREYSIKDLYPYTFGPEDIDNIELMLVQKRQSLKYLESYSKSKDDLLYEHALEAASCSYAPYSKNYSGIAVSIENGKMYTGGLIENAAYNITFIPLIPVIVQLLFSGNEFSNIEKVVFVDIKNGKSSAKHLTEILLKSVAPKAVFEAANATIC